jgi:hypothetical protein
LQEVFITKPEEWFSTKARDAGGGAVDEFGR